MARPSLLSLVAAMLLASAAPAGALPRDLWATINVCDTLGHPDQIGIRGSMPGLAGHAHDQMFMRFRVQYFVADDQRWHNIKHGADSGFVSAGRSNAVRQAGQGFVFAPPSGGYWRLRGKVFFQWRRGAGKAQRVVGRAEALTTAGHSSAAGADPAGYSAATCVIS